MVEGGGGGGVVVVVGVNESLCFPLWSVQQHVSVSVS